MKTPEHPAGPAFEKAADAPEAWRQQQIAAMTETQRGLYERACRRAEDKEKAKATELEKRKQADIQERMRQKLLAKPQLELHIAGKRTKITEVLANRLAEAYFQPGRPQDLNQFDMMVRQAAQAATREIEQEHKREYQAAQDRERHKLDRLLRRFERGRERQPQNRQDFARAAASGKAGADFRKAARDKALARAFAKVKGKQEQESQHGRTEQPRHRRDSARAGAGDKAKADIEQTPKDKAIARAFARAANKERQGRERGAAEKPRGHGR